MATPSHPGESWRPGTSAPGSSSPSSLPAWRRLEAPAKIPPRVRLARFVVALGLILATAALFVWLLLWLAPPGPAVLFVAGAGYETNLAIPANPQGREAITRLGRLAGTSSPLSWFFRRAGRLRLANPPLVFHRDSDWSNGLDDAPEQTILVFFSMLGGADARGAYLLPEDAGTDVSDRIRLGSILDRLAQLPEDKHKLLILDATAIESSWSLGLLHNDFARALDELESKITAIPNLVVLSASGLNQRSWPAADLRTSLFARSLFEGLLGKADANGDGRVHAWELYQFVSAQVAAEAQRLHGVVQTPVLLPAQEGEARARALQLTFQLDETALEGEPIGEPLADVEAAWTEYDQFRPRAEVARACVPGAWHLWQAWLLRYQEARLAGSPLADAVAEQLRAAGQRVQRGLNLSLLSESLTLEMPAVQGDVQLSVPYPYGPEDQLWQAAATDRQAVWQSLRRNDSEGKLRRNVLYALIRRAAENPARNLEHAAELVKLLDDPASVVRPAEAHFLVMLQRDLPVRPLPEDLNNAIREGLNLRLMAEEAALSVNSPGYAYAERIRPWIAATIQEADAVRQKGEDLLFASESAQWLRAIQLFGQAAKRHQQALEVSTVLREAFAARDRALAELPYLAQWVAHESDAKLLDRTLQLFEQTRRLDEQLQQMGNQHDAGKMESIRREAQAARAGLEMLQTRLDAFAQTCETNQSSLLRDGGVALRIPWLAAETRNRLLLRLTRLAKQARSEDEAKVEISPRQLDDRNRVRAIREGRLAMAALGSSWFDSSAPDAMTYADVEPFLRRPDLEGVWSKVLRWAGDEIALRFGQYPVQARRLVAESRKQPQLLAPLRRADWLQRHFNAGQWQTASVDAPVLYRRAEVESLLVWQAQRSYTDHWYNDDPRSAPYYRITGIDYLRDARRLDPFDRQESPSAAQVRKQLEAPDGVSIVADKQNHHLIAGDRLRLTATLEAKPGSDVAGYPVAWARLGDRLAFARLQDVDRVIVPAVGDRVSVTLTSPELEQAEQSPPLDAVAQQSKVVWHAYYRGQKPSWTTTIDLHPVAESTRNDYPPPPRAGVSIRADEPLFARHGRARGGLAVVVDCSGSEGPANDAPSRFRLACRALRSILEQVPRGTRLSLWIFGQAIPPRKSVTRAEETIQQLRSPAVWNGGKDEVEALVAQVEAQEPWNESPIARTILRAREDLLHVEGFRDLIVLTDGADNRFAQDAEANPKKEPIAEVLRRRFEGSGVTLHVVGFTGADGQPEAELVDNFSFVTTRLPRGTLTTVTNLTPLLDAMKRSMTAGLRYRLVGTGADESSSGIVEVSRPDENERWTFVPGGTAPYRLSVPLLHFEQPLTLRPGDFVLLDLDESERRWRRRIWSKLDPFRLRPARQTAGWRVAVMQDQILGERALQMLVAIEQESPRLADPGQVSPGAAWLELSPQASKAVPAVRWGGVAGYPAPTWGVDVPGWPIGEQGPPVPKLSAWWGKPSGSASSCFVRPGDFDHLSELLGSRRIGAERLTIDRAEIAEHWVQVGPGAREKRWCVVIGTAHEVEQPTWVQLSGVSDLAGQEHRHYRAAGRYVGLFWFNEIADEEALRRKIEQELTAVEVVSVAQFKREAHDLMQSAAFTDLDVPAALPPRPRPVWSPSIP